MVESSSAGGGCVPGLDSNCVTAAYEKDSDDVDQATKVSVTFESKRKRRYEYCLLLNLLLQVVVIFSIIGSVFGMVWLDYRLGDCDRKAVALEKYVDIKILWLIN